MTSAVAPAAAHDHIEVRGARENNLADVSLEFPSESSRLHRRLRIGEELPRGSVCEACDGRRFTADVLLHQLRSKDISEVLAMSIAEAREFFPERSVCPMLDSLVDVGLGCSLGQPLTAVVLDEPTTGLHMADVDNLIGLLDRLVDRGRTVVVIEH